MIAKAYRNLPEILKFSNTKIFQDNTFITIEWVAHPWIMPK